MILNMWNFTLPFPIKLKATKDVVADGIKGKEK